MAAIVRRAAVDVNEEEGESLADRAKRFATNQVRAHFFFAPYLLHTFGQLAILCR